MRSWCKLLLKIVGGTVLAGVAAGLFFRILSRRRAIPCPSWLVPLLENPYVRSLAGAGILLERAEVQPGMSVLDVGCGPGRLAIPAARRVGSGGLVAALDIQPSMINLLKKRIGDSGLANVRPLIADIASRPPAFEQFDRVLLVCVLGEVLDRAAALRHIHDSLKKGGLLSVTEIFPDPHYVSRAKLLRMATEAGFKFSSLAGTRVAYTMNLSR